MSETTTPQRPKNSTLIRRFLPYMAKYRGVLAFDLFCAALTTLCDIALPSIMRTLTNTVSAAALTVDTVLRLAALYFVLRSHRRRGKLLYVRHRAHHGRTHRDRHAPRRL